MRVLCVSTLPSTCAGDYNRDTKTIQINLPWVKKQPKWKRTFAAVFIHEFVHYVTESFRPWYNIVELYHEELIAYKVETWFCRLVRLSTWWGTPEQGAIASTTAIISWYKQYYKQKGKPFEWSK